MARSPAVSPLLACVLVALAAALPAARAQWQPDNYIADGDTCVSSGYSAGYNAAASACATARSQCEGGFMTGSSYGSAGAMSLPQCSNVAYGACQQAAAPSNAPCASEMAAGYGRCGPGEFQSYYASAASRACYAAATAITDVAPGTNSWAPQPGWYPSGPAVPAVISPGSVIGGAAGSAIGGEIAGNLGSAIGSAIGTRIGNSVDTAAINAVTSLVGGRKMLSVRVPKKQ